MKKIVSLLLLLAMAITVFCSCSSKTDWEYIEDKGVMKVGITIFKPMNYKDDEGNWTGFETEFAQKVAEIIGVEVEFVLIDWEKKAVELKSKTIDCVWNGMTVRDELKAEMDMSQSYIKNWQVAVIRKADAEKYTTTASMAEANVVAEKKSAGETAAKADDSLKNNFVSVDTQAKALMELKAGTADVAIIDYVMAIASVGEGTDYSDLMMVSGIELSAEEYAIGFRKNSPETKKKVDDAMNKLIADGTLNDLAVKYGIEDQLISNQGK